MTESSIRIIHSISGRTRIFFPTDLPSNHIEALGRSCPGVYSATYSAPTQNLLLFHYSFITAQEILSSLQPFQQQSTSIESSEVSTHLTHLAISGGALLLDLFFPTTSISWRALRSPIALLTLYLSKDILKNGLNGIKKYKANADTLSMTAIIASILQGNVRSALMITTLSSFGDHLAHRAASRTRKHLSELLHAEVKTAWLVTDHQTIKVPATEIHPGDVIAVHDGEYIPVDGKIISGTGTIDESAITGEFITKEAMSGVSVFAGTILEQGTLQILAEKVGSDTAIKQIVHLIQDAESSKAPVQLEVDRLANRLIFVSFLMASAVYLVTRNWNRALNMLVIDFCCGLKLTSATAFSACIGKAARNGILIRGGQTVENLAKVKTVVLDKTGTITEGKPIVQEVISTSSWNWKELLQTAASMEQYSSHPIADAIINEAKNLRIDIKEPTHLQNIPGRGIIGRVDTHQLYIGNKQLLEESLPHCVFPQLEARIDTMILVYIANAEEVLGVVCITDKLRPRMGEAVESLKQQGIDKVMLFTGDRAGPAREAAHSLNLDSFESNMLPNSKAHRVQDLQEQGSHVLMVGDGINDAPALAHASVGISFGGKKTDIAVEASDITINSNDPMALPVVYDLAKRTIKTVHQGITLVLVTNGVAMLCGALGWLSPLTSAIVHNSATVLVVLNSTRLYGKPLLHEHAKKHILKGSGELDPEYSHCTQHSRTNTHSLFSA